MGCGSSSNAPVGERNDSHINTNIDSTVTDNVRDPDKTDNVTIRVEGVDLNIAANTQKHHTNEFDITESTTNPKLVIRRGQLFEITIEFNRPYDSKKDDLRLVFAFGRRPNISHGTMADFILSDKDNAKTWGAMITSKKENSVRLTVMTPANCPVGKWKLMVDAVKRTDTETLVYRHKLPDAIYILFNPWCKDKRCHFHTVEASTSLAEEVFLNNKEDEVYFEDEDLKNEYVLNESGKIYSGNARRISAKPWTFGQFTGTVLDCIIYLLDRSTLPEDVRGYPVKVSRQISAAVNAPDDSGVLVGNWSGNYSGGTSPLTWTGSVAILDQYYQSKRPVKYGQCWVFSGIVTTVCRALGIPARSVTNFASAHDTDGSLTIDKYYDSDGNPIKNKNYDSVWNFHVWNDVWMARPDLPQGYGGWQAIDATPQETSNGIFRMGPTSLLAIKRGETQLLYDGPFVFAEVNGDRVYWTQAKDGSWQKRFVKDSVGKCLSTKKPATKDGGNGVFSWLIDSEREDVTNQYKFPEGSAENLAAVMMAVTTSSSNPIYEDVTEDVFCKIGANDNDMFLGDDVTLTLSISNKSSETRTINGKLNVHSMFYTGVRDKLLKSFVISEDVKAGEDRELQREISFSDYNTKLTDHCYFHATLICLVDETKQSLVSEEEFRFRKPHLELKAPNTGNVGETLKVDLTFVNPLPVALTKCELKVEGGGLQPPVTYKKGNVPSKEKYTGSFEITPKKVGKRVIIAYFNSLEIDAITGEHTITVQ